MSRLHIVAKSPYRAIALESCLAHASAGDGLILIADGVYAVPEKGRFAAKLAAAVAAGIAVFALEPDVDARGLKEDGVTRSVRLVDHAGFADLTERHRATRAWA